MTAEAAPGEPPVPDAEQENPIAALLREHGLRRVAIVDDYYDPLEQLELSANEAGNLWGLLEFKEDALAELSDLGHTVTGPADLTGPLLASVLANHEKSPGFYDAWQDSVAGHRREEQAGPLERIEEHLQHELGLTLGTFGSSASVVDMSRDPAQLILLDWRLGEDRESAIEAAARKATEIHKQWPPEQIRPLIVLMSSDPKVTSEAEEFRRRSGLMAGMFNAVSKADLTDQFSLHMQLVSLAMSLPAGHRVQAFIEAVRENVKKVGEDFVSGISALTLSDYAYIQSLSLQADGQPLGDYLMWLFSAYFGHLLFGRAMREQRDKLDQLTFKPLPSQTVPSRQLAEMYRYALFDVDVGPVTSHPRARSGSMGDDIGSAPEGEVTAQVADTKDPMLSLGDVFVTVRGEASEAGGGVGADAEGPPAADQINLVEHAEESALPDLMMIINAQCDLGFAPEGGRMIERGRSILLLPGTLHPLQEPIPDSYSDAPHTELYEYEGRGYRVLWNTKEVKTVPYGEFRRWHDGADDPQLGSGTARHERKARLRLPFALEVQRAFAADLTRVGMPVAPPIYQAVNIRLLGATDRKFDALEELSASEAAFLVLTRDGHKVLLQCVLTLPVVQRLRAMLEARLKMHRDQLNGDAGGEQSKERLQARVDALGRAIANHIEWAKLLLPIDMPTVTKARPFLGGYIQIVQNKSVGDECPTDKVIAAVSLQELGG
jgi:hypothetical protein